MKLSYIFELNNTLAAIFQFTNLQQYFIASAFGDSILAKVLLSELSHLIVVNFAENRCILVQTQAFEPSWHI